VSSITGLEGFNAATATGRTPPWSKYEAGSHTTSLTPGGINLAGDLQADTGTSEVTRGLWRAAGSAGLSVAYTEIIHETASRNRALPPDVTYGAPYAFSLVDVPVTRFYDSLFDVPRELVEGKYNIAYWAWEFAWFPEITSIHWDMINEVWVNSHHARKAVATISPLPVTVMHPVVDVRDTQGSNRALFGLPEDRSIFLFTFSPASFFARKNPFDLIEAFRLAFGSSRNGPLLVIKTHHLNMLRNASQIAADLQTALHKVNGLLLQDNLSRQQMLALIASCDYYVSLHRAEGFGLAMAEAMALGKPVIATQYSGNTDFMTPDNSYGVNYTLRAIEKEDHHYQPSLANLFPVGVMWAQPDINHAAELMQRVVEQPDDAHHKGAQAAQDISLNFGASALGRRMKERLTEIVDISGGG